MFERIKAIISPQSVDRQPITPLEKELYSDNQVLTSQNAQLSGQLSDLTNNFNLLQSNYDALGANFNALQSNYDGLTIQVNSLLSENENLRNQLEQLQYKFDQLNNHYNSQTLQINSLLSENEQLRNQLAQKTATTIPDSSEYIAQITALTNENERLKADNVTLLNDREYYKKAYDYTQGKLNKSMIDINNLQNSLSVVNDNLKASLILEGQLRNQIAGLQSKLNVAMGGISRITYATSLQQAQQFAQMTITQVSSS